MRARLHVSRSTGTRSDRSGDTDSPEAAGRAQGHRDDRATDTGPAGRDRSSSHRREPLYIDPERLVAEPPEYPRPADTRAALLADPERTYTVERHHEYHANAVEEWRASVPDRIRDRLRLETPAGPTDVTVRTLERDLM